GSTDFEARPPQSSDLGLVLCRALRGATDKHKPLSLECGGPDSITFAPEFALLGFADITDGCCQMGCDVIPIEHDLRQAMGHTLPCRRDIRIPHVHHYSPEPAPLLH